MINQFEGFAYHYTSLNSAVEMLRNQELWLTSIRSLNDAGEWYYALQATIELLNQNGFETVANYLNRTVAFVLSQEGLHTDSMEAQYIFCLSKAPNDVSQWRLYGDGGNGVCIDFDVGLMCSKDRSLRAYEVCYGIEQAADTILEFARSEKQWSNEDQELFSGPQLANLDEMLDARGLLYQTAFLKHPSFFAEKEVRIIFTRSFGCYIDEDGDMFSKPSQNSMNVKADFRVSNGRLIPYIKREFSPFCIRRIICQGKSACIDNTTALTHFLRTIPNCGHIDVVSESSLYR